MSEKTEGRVASDYLNGHHSPDTLRVIASVRRECIEEGYNVGPEVTFDFAIRVLPPVLRRVLREVIEYSAWRESERAWELRDARYGPSASLTVVKPTLAALRDELEAILGLEEARERLRRAEKEVEGIVSEAVARALGPVAPDTGLFDDGNEFYVRFSPVAVSLVRGAMGPGLDEAVDEFRAAARDERLGRERLHDVMGVPVVVPTADWLPTHLATAAIGRYVWPMRDGPASRHADVLDLVETKMRRDRKERERLDSPEGIVEAVLERLGTSSQVERWREGFLPDEETDAVLARHVFERVLDRSGPERRLEREDVQAELRKARPSASVARLAFATEEAQGLTEAEWEAFKSLRGRLPEGASANVVRTVATVQTAADGGFVLRRSLVSLKATFAGREVRARVELGTGFELRVA